MMQLLKYIISLCFCILVISVVAQDGKRINKSQGNTVNSSVSKLSKTLEDSRDDEVLANDYIDVAKELIRTEDYIRAEDYLKRALNIYVRQKNRQQMAVISRELAKVLEAQGKISEAISTFTKAAEYADNKSVKEINRNDANRLSNPTDIQSQQAYVQQNLDILNSTQVVKEEEKMVAYQQMGQLRRQMNDNAGAIEDFNNALEVAKDQPEAFKIKQDIANTLVADAKYDEAIALNESLVAEAQQTQKPDLAISQMQNLSQVYFDSEKPEKGFQALEDAYRLAVHENQTLTARNVLEQLISQYQQQHQTKQAMALYADFIGRLDTLVKNDSTLVDEQFLALHEEKISQLERERELKDELIARTNNYNYVLLGSVILALLALLLITRVLMLNMKKSKKIALQSLRREMNPHFIFNSLNSVNQFIAQNKELEANKYLSSYSKLMRTIMEHSNKDFIPLATEIEQMEEYLQLEHQRFQDKFTYTVEVDEALDTDQILIPNMLIQPQLENAVWHGLRYKDGVGHLLLSFTLQEKWIIVIIEDDGIGLQQSIQLKTKHQKTHQSRGMMNTNERIELLNSLYHTKISIEMIDKTGNESGVKVILRFPLMDKRG
ncbi:MAG: histidine kinase [Tannerella sp.]|jgi:tetratricopeptide (TPR) repeat protein|nr:histidine kinase [Tannerella sp.]